ncbi:MAG: heavy metal translocating P-type ATPase [Magnetococcales bacterium]|nr:heavy metal translocating P-type ATPase [Magnetococcales bacterium]
MEAVHQRSWNQRTPAADDAPDDAVEETLCEHCGLPAPNPVFATVHGERQRFCCVGCRSAWSWIHEAGLEAFYDHRDDQVTGGRPVDVDRASFTAYDSDSFQERFVTKNGDLSETTLLLEGLHCAACAWLNEKAIERLPGVASVRVNYALQQATIRWNQQQLNLSEIVATIHHIGYGASPHDPASIEEAFRKRQRDLMLRVGVAGFGAVNVMGIAIALYAGYFQGLEDNYKQFFHWVSLVLATPVVFFSGALFLRGAIAGLRARMLTMDLPIALGMLVTYGFSVVTTLRNQGEVYFDSVTMFVFVLLVGRLLEGRARARAAEVTERLLQHAPETATRFDENRNEERVAVHALRSGDRIIVRPGERIPVDGVIVSGRASMDESLLTGESMPRVRRPGDSLAGGSLSVDGTLVMRATRTGSDSALARIVQLVGDAQSTRPPMRRLADTIAARFVAAILTLAVATLLYWYHVDPTQAIENTVALLIITCPCALGLSIPAALIVAFGAAAKEGIIIRNGDVLERLRSIGTVIFDKTGTLTRGVAAVDRLVAAPEIALEHLLRTAAAVEYHASHPIARAIVAKARTELSEPLPEVTDFHAIVGEGVSGWLQGRKILVGSPAYLRKHGSAETSLPALPEDHAQLSWTGCMEDGRFLGWIGLSDQIKPDARETIAHLKKRVPQVTLASGDRLERAQSMANTLGITDVIGEMSPADKSTLVSKLQQQGQRVAMVGEGINDAPAMARADLSIAVAEATDLSASSADVVLINTRLRAIPRLMDLSERTHRIIRQNIAFSILYNLIAIPLAMSGYVLPVVAAIAMPLSSVTVVANAMRIRSKSPHLVGEKEQD